MIRSVYRVIIREVRRFPSIKRDSLEQEIRAEFRENITLADPQKLKLQVDIAIKGVSQLRAYTGIDQTDPNWAVRMEENPMPAPDESKELGANSKLE